MMETLGQVLRVIGYVAEPVEHRGIPPVSECIVICGYELGR
ncbi:hypothetical protein [Paenibacillus amylolyticus]|nr:hypothetical protein [Paenibacillus amylolyticus]